jgi:hypothetical protein
MRRASIFFGVILTIGLIAVSGFAQNKLQGRWEGKVQAPQGDMPTAATFKQEGAGYTGSINLMGRMAPFKEIKVDGDKITAQSSIDTPQASIPVNFDFTVQGDKLTGKGSADFGGQTFSFDFDLKKVSDNPDAPASAGTQSPAQPGGRGQQRPQVPQPQQKPSLEYFSGNWSFKWVGRESPLGPGGPRNGIVSFKPAAGGKTLEGRLEAKTEEGSLTNNMVIGWDEATKILTFTERLSNGVQISSKCDWNSPISIRCAVEPIKVKGQSLVLKRVISVVAAHSFTVTEELSEAGGPFVRLGNALFTKEGSGQ